MWIQEVRGRCQPAQNLSWTMSLVLTTTNQRSWSHANAHKGVKSIFMVSKKTGLCGSCKILHILFKTILSSIAKAFWLAALSLRSKWWKSSVLSVQDRLASSSESAQCFRGPTIHQQYNQHRLYGFWTNAITSEDPGFYSLTKKTVIMPRL